MMIKLEHVEKYFGDLHVLKDVNLEVKEGEKLAIIRPSGSGKSTTVRCMNFLETPTSGRVYIDGEELTPEAPLVLDDALVRFDDKRMAAALDILREMAKDKQVICFTCQGRESEVS